ncbi:MAG TPA: hypothetical protein VNZ44_17750, partial [Pyrinomonadaceae bacterium]|nr:hypothetical protein [Pyrinomonadaceae bacterium]
PFEGIDPAGSRNVKDLLRTLSGRGVTVFITSHILEVVERLVDSFAVVVRGEVVCTRTLEELARDGLTLEDAYFRHVERHRAEAPEWAG